MAIEPSASGELEALRLAELERRERLRQDREGGVRAPLRARRRSAAIGRLSDQPGASVLDDQLPQFVPLPGRIEHSLRRVAEELGEDATFVDHMRQRATHAANPLRSVASDTLELLSRMAPLSALGHLEDLTADGLPFLEDDERFRAEALRSGRLPAPEGDLGPVDAWQLHAEAVEARGRAVLSTTAWQRLVARLPLPVVDDLIDMGALTKSVIGDTWQEVDHDRARYVTARLDPDVLTDAEVRALAWRDEECRRILETGGTVAPVDGRHDEWSLRSALLDGDVSSLDRVRADQGPDLPPELFHLVRSLLDIRQGATVDGRLGRDRSLFGLMEDCVPEGRLISGTTSFHFWAGTRRMYRILDDMHWAMACEPERTEHAVRAALQQAAVLRSGETHGAAGAADREARVVQAYLIFLHARPGDRDRLDQGVGLLEDVLKRGGRRRGGVGGVQRRRLRALSELLQSLRLKSKPHDVLNPYLALCVQHDSTEWGQGWRDLRRQVAAEQIEYINGAKDRIRRIETARRVGEGAELLYELPLHERFLWVPDDRSELLQPWPRPLARGTRPSTEQEKSWTATEAAREIIGRCVERLRNDH
ncbi:hypothetical protein [Streptomyces sp. NPDC003247]|uniref:hypothetical protein n=1 Tax=Streptomyces sp. NPDC003247 TaxID=3364677 RepID=UPI0036B6DFFD